MLSFNFDGKPDQNSLPENLGNRIEFGLPMVIKSWQTIKWLCQRFFKISFLKKSKMLWAQQTQSHLFVFCSFRIGPMQREKPQVAFWARQNRGFRNCRQITQRQRVFHWTRSLVSFQWPGRRPNGKALRSWETLWCWGRWVVKRSPSYGKRRRS